MRHLRLLFLLILVFVGIKMCASNNCDTIPTQQLNEIIIKSNKPHIKDENGILVVNLTEIVKDKPVSNILEALGYMPGVTNNNGMIWLTGASNVTIIVNGELTNMPLQNLYQLLYTTPVDRLKNVEIMYSAPAKYHVNGAVINVVLNSPKPLDGLQGQLRTGYNQELDELHLIAADNKTWMQNFEQKIKEETGIKTMKVGFNKVFGYYIEVRNVHKDKVPKEWIRKQTLVNAERYITQELKEYEEKILGAEDKILVLETQLYTNLVQALTEFIPQIQVNANQIARLDCLLSFANVARENNYIRPVIEDNDVLDIRQGRHPVIEKQLPIGEKYIANNVMLDSSTQQIIIITGPNMAGKSALLRQTALITLLAQIGSFVPAESAHIGLVDKIFTRVGASDNISVGESTFMVEMNEAADILNNVSSRSLVLFDELGRGTSTYDGISIAWAIVEYIHEHPKAKARTLFATHYHELNEMEKSFKRIKNYNVSVKEVDNKVIFLRKLERGGSEHSFGIHVAKMAGMPKSIVKRANEILKQLESDNRQQGIAGKPLAEVSENRGGMQLSFFQLDDPILCQIRDEILNLDVNNLTPIEALNKLNDIKKIVRGK